MKALTLAIAALAVLAPINAAMAAAAITVPEPASLSLMAVGVAGVFLATRFRKKK